MTAPASLPKVSGFAVELTSHCNQKCRYCYNAWRGAGALPEPVEVDTVVRRVRRLIETFAIGHFTLTGGEPCASPALFPLLELIRGAGVPVQIISNGALIDDAIAEGLARFRPSYVQCTLNGADAEGHDLHTGPGQFDKTLRGIRALQREGVRVGGCVVITSKNAQRLGAILEVWRGLGVRQVALSRFSPAGYAARFASELLPTVEQMHAALEQASPFATQHGMSLYSTMPLPPCAVQTERFRGVKFGSCAIGTPKQEFALGPSGGLRHCTLHRSPIGGSHDILDSGLDLAELVTSEPVTGYRKRFPGFCSGCVHAERCGGGCGAASEWAFDDHRATPDPFLWQHVDEAYAASLGRAQEELGEP